MQPELWAPTTGVIRKLPAYEQKQGATAVPLEMAPYESMFIVFKDKAGAASSTDVAANFPVPAQIADLKGRGRSISPTRYAARKNRSYSNR